MYRLKSENCKIWRRSYGKGKMAYNGETGGDIREHFGR
jgi:hypothetical protein